MTLATMTPEQWKAYKEYLSSATTHNRKVVQNVKPRQTTSIEKSVAITEREEEKGQIISKLPSWVKGDIEVKYGKATVPLWERPKAGKKAKDGLTGKPSETTQYLADHGYDPNGDPLDERGERRQRLITDLSNRGYKGGYSAPIHTKGSSESLWDLRDSPAHVDEVDIKTVTVKQLDGRISHKLDDSLKGRGRPNKDNTRERVQRRERDKRYNQRKLEEQRKLNEHRKQEESSNLYKELLSYQKGSMRKNLTKEAAEADGWR